MGIARKHIAATVVPAIDAAHRYHRPSLRYTHCKPSLPGPKCDREVEEAELFVLACVVVYNDVHHPILRPKLGCGAAAVASGTRPGTW